MNSIVIEQNSDQTRLAFEVNQHATIHRIRLARARLAAHSLETSPISPIAVTFHFKSKSLPAPAGSLRVEIDFRMTGVEPQPKPARHGRTAQPTPKRPPTVLVECAFELDYLLHAGFILTPAHAKAFKDGNAIFNAWPFFREYLQNNLLRMGLPPLTAPFVRLQPKAKLAKAPTVQPSL